MGPELFSRIVGRVELFNFCTVTFLQNTSNLKSNFIIRFYVKKRSSTVIYVFFEPANFSREQLQNDHMLRNDYHRFVAITPTIDI